MEIKEGHLTFIFPDNLSASKYDDWAFYRNQFNNTFGGAKAVDLIVLDKRIVWLIEPVDVKLKLKKLLKGIDAHPLVVDKNNLHPDMKWSIF